MVAVMGMAGGVKPPGAVITGDAVGKILAGQPFQYTINGDAIHAAPAVNPLFQFLMRKRTVCREQSGKHFDARRSDTGAGAPDQSLSLLMMLSRRHAEIETRSRS